MMKMILVATLLAAAAPCLAQDDGGRPSFRIDPDPRFGRGGAVRSLRAGRRRMDAATWSKLDAAGRIVVAGYQRVPAKGDDYHTVPLVARLSPNGRLDRSFGSGGIAALPLHSVPMSLDIDSLGRIVVALWSGETPDVTAARLLADGRLDASFADDGLFRSPIGAGPFLHRVRVDPTDDSLLAMAENAAGEGVVRLAADGTIDTSYAGDGFAELPAVPYDLAVDARGGALVALQALGVVRLAADGSRDGAFGGGGAIVGPLGLPITTDALCIDGQGRIVVYGVEAATGFDFGLRRFLPDGSPDFSVGEGGLLPTTSGLPGAVAPPRFVLGAAARTDRFLVAAPLEFLGSDLQSHLGIGLYAQLFDRAAPDRVATVLKPERLTSNTMVRTFPWSVLLTDDGRAAYVVGVVTATKNSRGHETPIVTRFDLVRLAPRPALKLAVEWERVPAVAGPPYAFHGSFRVKNADGAAAPGVRVAFYLSGDDVLDPSDRRLFDQPIGWTAARSSQSIALAPAAFDLASSPHGMRLIAELQGQTADPRGRVAVSAPIE